MPRPNRGTFHRRQQLIGRFGFRMKVLGLGGSSKFGRIPVSYLMEDLPHYDLHQSQANPSSPELFSMVPLPTDDDSSGSLKRPRACAMFDFRQGCHTKE